MIDSRLLTGRFFIAEECMSEQEALSLLEAILTQFPNTILEQLFRFLV